MNIADKLRPNNLDELVGHKDFKKIIEKQINTGFLQNLIIYGNSGTGKSTISTILSKQNFLGKKVYKINAATSNLADLKEILKETTYIFNTGGLILIVDEIHMYNKREIQILLEHIENGTITLIGLTTENPYSTLPQGIVSRCVTIYLNPLSRDELKIGVKRAIERLSVLDKKEIQITNAALVDLIKLAPQGDMRQILNILESLLHSKAYYSSDEIRIDINDIKSFRAVYSNPHSANSTVTFNLLSALQKSIRGSDINASIYYLARLLHLKDASVLAILCRRLRIIAYEDISLPNINALLVTENAVETALKVGFPECKIPLATVVVLLASSPQKSNTPYIAIKQALSDIENGGIYEIPNHLKNRNKQNGQPYLYPHDYENNYVEQQYLPDELIGRVYYKPGDNPYEQYLASALDEIKTKK